MIETQNILIVRYGEIALKGMNKPYFERMLLKRIRKALDSAAANAKPRTEKIDGDVLTAPAKPRAETADGLIIVRGYAPDQEKELTGKLLRIFGVATVSPAWELSSREQEDINAAAVLWMERRLHETGCKIGCDTEHDTGCDTGHDTGRTTTGAPQLTFKVFGKRADKSWPVTSPEIAALAGEAILEAFGEPCVKVNVRDPEVRLHVHLRRKNVLIYDDSLKGFGGLPLGTNGKGLVLLSGGIDSPVAAWMMAKRGMSIEAVHFHSYPYTSKRAEEKVQDLADILASYCGRIKIYMFNLLPAQEALAEFCPEEEMTILIRRFMIRIASKVAAREECGFLITGENLGQVASQTAEGIAVTDNASSVPILRPLIALDKVDIMDLAQNIGTYETSIQPYEDCCTVFLPKHPVTKPALSAIKRSEDMLGKDRIAELEEEVLASEDQYIARV